MKKMTQQVVLNSGYKMPRLGLGTYLATEEKDVDVIATAITRYGYRHIDTAAFYKNERVIGKALKKAFDAGIKREELFITTKLWNTMHGRVEEALKQSLEKLDLNYVNLYLMHTPVAIKKEGDEDTFEQMTLERIPVSSTWKDMEKCQKKGMTQNIGVSNFKFQILNDLLSYAEVLPVCNQIELHPYLNQFHLVEWMKTQNIQPVAYSPLGAAYVTHEEKHQPMHDPLIVRLAEKYKKTPGQILLAWGFARGHVEIPKSNHLERIKENFDSQFIELSQEDFEAINKLDRNLRVYGGVVKIGFLETYPIFD